MLHATCGNKVSPASLLNTNDSNSADTGIMSGGESQHSQVSLFDGSEGPNSLELFSQPLSKTQNGTPCTASTASQNQPASTASMKLMSIENCGQKISDGKKYYLKYLSAIASTSKIQHHISDGTSVCNAQTECMASNISFKAWKYKQQEKLERKGVIEDISEVIGKDFTTKICHTIGNFQDEMKSSISELRDQTERHPIQQKALDSSLAQLLGGQEETKTMVQELRTDIEQQRLALESLSSQLSSLSSSIPSSIASLFENLISQTLTTALQRSSTSTTTVGTQTSLSSNTTTENVLLLTDSSPRVVTDQAVPTVLPTIPHDAVEERLYGERPVEGSHSVTNQSSNDLPICSSMRCNKMSESEFTRTVPCMLEPSPVYDLDLTQLPVIIKQEPYDFGDIKRRIVYGKRRLPLEETPQGLNKQTLPRKSVSVTSKKIILPKKRRSKRRIQKYCHSSSEEANEFTSHSPSLLENQPSPNQYENKVLRKVSTKLQGRLCSHESCFYESPVNALSDAFYSGTSAVLQSAISNSQNVPPEPQKKFHRSDESAKRRNKVISDLTDSGNVLREIKDSIYWNNAGSSEPSP